MRLRAFALALALSFGLTASMDARQKPAVHQSKAMKKAAKKARAAVKKSKGYKQSKVAKVKPRKASKRHA